MNDELTTVEENPYRSPLTDGQNAQPSAAAYPSASSAFLAGAKRGATFGANWVGLALGTLAFLLFAIIVIVVSITAYQYGLVAFRNLGALKGMFMFIFACAWTTFCAAAASTIIMGIGETIAYLRQKKKDAATTAPKSPKNMCRILLFIVMFLCGAVAGSLRAQDSPSGIEAAAAIEKTFVDVIARAEKSVVAIARVRRERPGEVFQLETRPDPFGRRPMPLAPPQPTDPDFIPNEYAAGVFVGPGLVLTAAHVLGDESDYYVTTIEHKVYKATVRAADPRSDLAVLTIGATDLPAVGFGNADELKKGQIVIGLGNPYAIARDGQPSAAWGIVANLQRKAPATATESDPTGRPALYYYGTLIQTDAKLGLGTSGGPLLNLRGEMVGLSVALAAAAGYETPGGYAIPVDATFRRAVEILKRGREVEYGFLGVRPMNLVQEEVLRGMTGTRVSQVFPGTPAARFGLRAGDVITAVDGAPLHDSDGLVLNVGKLPADAVTRLTVWRGGTIRTVSVELSKYAVRGRKIVTETDPPWRGLRVEYTTAVVDDEGRLRFISQAVQDAVAVVEVADGSPAAAAGLRRGMLITHVDRQPVRTPKEFALAVARNRGPVQLRLAGDEKNPIRTVAAEM
ncbi:MAG: trypsin-like peptidase domain-containing protein [Thermoguttaceae bacterium]